MHDDVITFEFATHYRPKVALRLERLFAAIEQACQENHPIIHHYALKNVIEIIKLIEKPELKSRFIKELIRFEHQLNRLAEDHSPQLFHHVQVLNNIPGKFGETIHNDPFLQFIRLAQTAHPSDCELHTPTLLLWLDNHSDQRQGDLTKWMACLQTLADTVNLYLFLLRKTAIFEPICLNNGFYQQSLSSKLNCHLILLRMQKKTGAVPQLQFGHHGLILRLQDAHSLHDRHDSDLTIDLALCQL